MMPVMPLPLLLGHKVDRALDPAFKQPSTFDDTNRKIYRVRSHLGTILVHGGQQLAKRIPGELGTAAVVGPDALAPGPCLRSLRSTARHRQRCDRFRRPMDLDKHHCLRAWGGIPKDFFIGTRHP